MLGRRPDDTPAELSSSFAYDKLDRLRPTRLPISFRDLAVTEAVLAANGVSCAEVGGRLVVSATPGQGVVFAFEEK